MRSGQSSRSGCGTPNRKAYAQAREGPEWGPAGKDRARAETGPLGRGRGGGTHLRDLFAILQVPHRRGLGGDAGQPPPAWGECSLSETHPPLPPLLHLGGRERNAGPVRSGPGATEGQRGGPRPAAPSRGPARPGMPWTCQEACSRPPPAPPAASSSTSASELPALRGSVTGADPRPLPAASSSAALAASCRVLSAPPNLAPSLPQEPPFESAHAAPNLIGWSGRAQGGGGGAASARAAEGGAGGAGSQEWNSRDSGSAAAPWGWGGEARGRFTGRGDRTRNAV